MTENCGNCRFWECIHEGLGVGKCRRHTPAPTMRTVFVEGFLFNPVIKTIADMGWPETRDEDWCAEWEAKKV